MVAMLKMPNRFTAGTEEERRLFPRKQVEAEVQASRSDHTLAARREPRLTLSLRDLSLGGLSAISTSPLAQGERLSIQFPPLGNHGPWDARGRVLRCAPSAMGYRVSVEFDTALAA